MNETPEETNTEPTHEELLALHKLVIDTCIALGCPKNLIQKHKPTVMFTSLCLMISKNANLFESKRN